MVLTLPVDSIGWIYSTEEAPLLSTVIDPGIDPQISNKKSHLVVYELLYGRAISL